MKFRTLALLAATLSAGALAQVPRPADPIEIISSTGQKVSLSALKGKVVAVEFLLTHCPGCKHSATLLAKLRTEYGAQGFEVIGLAIDEGAGLKIPQFIRETGANFPIGVFHADKAHEYLRFSVMSRMMMPQLVLIDRQGQIREQHAGDDPWMAPAIEETNVRKALARLLAEKPGRAAAKSAPAKKK